MKQITMPRLSDTMEEGAISTWHKNIGDHVEAGEVLADPRHASGATRRSCGRQARVDQGVPPLMP